MNDRGIENGAFFVLPLELRQMIYDKVLAAGHIDLLRVSKMVHEEASARVREAASLRLYLDGNDKFPTMPKTFDLIKQVELRFEKGRCRPMPISLELGPPMSPIRQLLAPNITRYLVRVVLSSDYPRVIMLEPEPYCIRLVKNFSRVKVLSLTITTKPCTYFNDIYDIVDPRFYPRLESGLTPITFWAYRRMKRGLEPFLGPGQFREGAKDHGLTFHPLAFTNQTQKDGELSMDRLFL